MLYLAFLILLTCTVQTDSNPRPVLVESWNQTLAVPSTQHFEIKVDSDNRVFNKEVFDSKGQTLFRLSLSPDDRGEKSPIAGWVLSMIDPPSNKNLLAPSNDPDQDFDSERDFTWIFNSQCNAPVSILSKRIFKFKNFYVVVSPVEYRVGKSGMTELKLLIDVQRSAPPEIGNAKRM